MGGHVKVVGDLHLLLSKPLMELFPDLLQEHISRLQFERTVSETDKEQVALLDDVIVVTTSPHPYSVLYL